MRFFDHCAVLVLSLNEAPNIERTLAKLPRFARVFVLDSGSTDQTRELAAKFSNVTVLERAFDRLDTQWNFAAAQAKALLQPSPMWLLSLDADYVLSDALLQEIATLDPVAAVNGYRCAFEFWIDGQPICASLYPPRVVLFRAEHSFHQMRGHAQDLQCPPPIATLAGRIYHDDRKPFSRFVANQRSYARQEAQHLLATPASQLRWQDKVRRLGIIAPWLVPVLSYARTWRSGKAAMKYMWMRFVAETEIAKAIWRFRFQRIR
jgi:glycosyltransferase involved in cell wall biosynthesis